MAKIQEEFPPIRRGGSLIVAWQTKEKKVLIIGGGSVAAMRIVSVLEADATVILVCPEDGLNDEVRYRIEQNQVQEWINREFREEDLSGDIDMVLTAIDDPKESYEIYKLCRARKIPVNVADAPSLCDFYFMSQHRDGPLQVAVSTNGQGPKLANVIRRHIADTLPKGTGDAIRQVGILRQKLRQMDPEHASSSKRMNWMSKVCEEWTIDELKQLDERTMDRLLAFYEKDEVPSYTNISSKTNNVNDKNGHSKDITIKAKNLITEEFAGSLAKNHGDNPQVQPAKKGRIILVGAGPGDPLLLTHKATQILSNADLVLSDRLVPPAILAYAKCEVRFSGSKSGAAKSRDSQDQLSTWGLEALREGKTVVRLKIGDPFLFGRGGEEVQFFRKNGWDAEVVPGISSAFSTPMAANVPVTYRGIADQVLITTGQGTQGRTPEIPTYHSSRTTVILMAVAKANELSKILLKKEYPPDLSAVFVENSNRPNERILYATVATLGQVVESRKVVSPATLVIGRSVDELRVDFENQEDRTLHQI